MNSQVSNSDGGGGGVSSLRNQINNHHPIGVKRNKSQFSLTNEHSSLIDNDNKNENLARSFYVEPVEEEVLQPGSKAMNLGNHGSHSMTLGY